MKTYTCPRCGQHITDDQECGCGARRINKATPQDTLHSIIDWCYPAAIEMPSNEATRCVWYARRLMLIANAARAALEVQS